LRSPNWISRAGLARTLARNITGTTTHGSFPQKLKGASQPHRGPGEASTLTRPRDARTATQPKAGEPFAGGSRLVFDCRSAPCTRPTSRPDNCTTGIGNYSDADFLTCSFQRKGFIAPRSTEENCIRRMPFKANLMTDADAGCHQGHLFQPQTRALRRTGGGNSLPELPVQSALAHVELGMLLQIRTELCEPRTPGRRPAVESGAAPPGENGSHGNCGVNAYTPRTYAIALNDRDRRNSRARGKPAGGAIKHHIRSKRAVYRPARGSEAVLQIIGRGTCGRTQAQRHRRGDTMGEAVQQQPPTNMKRATSPGDGSPIWQNR